MSELTTTYDAVPNAVQSVEPLGHEPFPAFAESCYLALARRAFQGRLPSKAIDDSQPFLGAELRDRLGVDGIESRLGDSMPQLSACDESLVLQHFALAYPSIPDTLPRYQKSREHADRHHHDHGHTDDHGCTKIHGPLQRFIENTADRVSAKFGGRRAKASILIGMRSLLFCICPGDDILAIGAQAFSGAAPHSFHVEAQHDELAVLPPKVNIVSRPKNNSHR